MKQKKRKTTPTGGTIALNKKARHDYFIRDTLEAGIVLQGLEVKSIRSGRVQLVDSYVVLKGHEVFLIGCHFSPLISTSTHIIAEPSRSRKLLLHRHQINKLIGYVERQGSTLVALSLYWKNNHVKVELGLVEGKKQHDKRAANKEREWAREKARIMKHDR